jgi:hypothetical protein
MRQKEREEFISIMSQEGVRLDVARAFLRAGASLHRIAELECSSEAADRDRVRCPGKPRTPRQPEPAGCLCRDYGSYDPDATTGGKSSPHGTVPRIAVRGAQIEARLQKIAKANGLGVITGGDPRGAVLIVTLPSGRSNDWGGRGVVAG